MSNQKEISDIKMHLNVTPYIPVQYSPLECRIFNLISKKKVQFNF